MNSGNRSRIKKAKHKVQKKKRDIADLCSAQLPSESAAFQCKAPLLVQSTYSDNPAALSSCARRGTGNAQNFAICE
jgi:hypothetical protein